ncbi:Nucleic acid-binding, OB-fold [Sesbania bispinosa]|nr:Nucleic acid-binding, OB-fold [Sesbania bispinosa]
MTNVPLNREIKVKDISNEIGYWIIKVKVARIWPRLDSIIDYKMLSLEMVLIDSKGTKIQGSIPIEVFNLKYFDIAEEGFYKIGRVIVVDNDGMQRETPHPFRLVFTHKSFMKEWQPRSFTSSGLTTFTAGQIKTYVNDLEHFIERVHILDGRVVNMVLLELTDHTGRIECILYDQYVDQLHEHIKSNGMRSTLVVIQFAKMVPFDAALFGYYIIEVIPNLTKFLFNPPITEVFEAYDWLDLFAPLRYVRRGRTDAKVLDTFLIRFCRKSIPQLCFEAKVRMFVVLATMMGVVGNDQWWKLYSDCLAKGNQKYPLGYSYNDKNSLPRYNLKAQVFDGAHSLNLLLNDHHLMKLLVKLTTQAPTSSNLDEAFQCIIGRKFLFIIEKGCHHQISHDDWLKAKNLCADPEILRVFVDRDHYSLDLMAKAKIVATLKRFTPIDDSFLISNHHSGGVIYEPSIRVDVGQSSSSARAAKNPSAAEKPIARSLDSELSESRNM